MSMQFYHSHVLDSFPVEVVLLCFVQSTLTRALDEIKKWEIGHEIQKLYNSDPCCWSVLFLAQCISVYISPQACQCVRFCFLVFDSTHPPASPVCLLFWHTHWFGGLMIKNFVQQKAQWCIHSYDVSLFVHVWDFVDQPLIPECMEVSGWLTKESNCCLRQELETSAWWGLHYMDHKTCGCLPV